MSASFFFRLTAFGQFQGRTLLLGRAQRTMSNAVFFDYLSMLDIEGRHDSLHVPKCNEGSIIGKESYRPNADVARMGVRKITYIGA